MLINNSIKDYMDDLSSDRPAPGGGSVSAVSGSLGVSIMQMVCSLSIGKKGLEDYQDILVDMLDKSQAYKDYFLQAIDEDCNCYPSIISAYRLPKNSDQEKKDRLEQIQKAYKYATEIPFTIGQKGHEFLDLLEKVIDISNKNIITDAYVSANQMQACIDGALINAKINLNYIKDQEYREDIEKKIEFILEDSKLRLDVIRTKIKNMI
ncbi:MAG: cyclodeaminase/cyclohydrolase family protein [Tissierellia bacterium]|nr:cyclodeaminase/cyclohydrolase family protein [Tissierellia bacterium]